MVPMSYGDLTTVSPADAKSVRGDLGWDARTRRTCSVERALAIDADPSHERRPMSRRTPEDAGWRGPIHTVVSTPGPRESALLERHRDLVEVRRVLGAGVSLRLLTTRRAPPQAPHVVLLHGRGHAASLWLPVIASLAPRFRVSALDLPGFGHSGWPLAASSSQLTRDRALRAFVEPVADALASLAPTFLVGHSLGGLVALASVLRYEVRPAALALVGSMGLSAYARPRARLYLHAGPERLASLSRLWPRGAGPRDPELAELAAVRTELLTAHGADRAKAAFDALLPLSRPAESLEGELGELALPTLLLWGERDEAFPLPVAMKAQGLIRGAELSVMDTGHSPHLERPHRVAESLDRFFSGVKLQDGLAPVRAASR
jgi:pimeloyl-ACP methyl ester carboxylesterase